MRIVPLLFICCAIFSCRSSNSSRPQKEVNTIHITKENLQELPSFIPEQLIDSCTYIPLETSKQVLIGNVEKLQVKDRFIFLVNGENDSLYVFNRQGKFLNTIGTQGRGPQEYINIRSYCTSPQGDTVIIFDSNKLLFYTQDNHFIQSVNLIPHLHQVKNIIRTINSIHWTAPDKLLFKYDMMYNCKVFYSTYNYNTHELKDIASMPLSLNLGNAMNRVTLSFLQVAEWNQQLSCPILFNDTIFEYQRDTLFPRFIVDALKDKIIPDNVFRQLEDSAPQKAAYFLVNSGIFIKTISESDAYFFILYNGKEPQELIWNKHTQKGILIKLDRDFSGHTFVPMAVSPLAISNDKIYDDRNSGHRYYPVLHQKTRLKSLLHEEDNPVIVIYHLKPNF